MENVRSQCRRLQDGLLVYVAEVLVVIQYSELVVRSGHTTNIVLRRAACIVMKSFICRGCSNLVTSTGRTSVDIGVSANLEIVDKFCYLGDMLWMEMLIQLWRPESKMDGINSGSWFHCLPIGIGN